MMTETMIAETLFCGLDPIRKLIELVEEETGANTICADDPDNESVGADASGPLPMTFGHVRRARNAYDRLSSLSGESVTVPGVKALEWHNGSATSLGLTYDVWLDRNSMNNYQETWVAVLRLDVQNRIGVFEHEDEALSACQADFERRVLSSLSTHTTAGAAPVEEAEAKAREGLFLIRKRGAYYRPNEQGYTSSTVEAGRYSRADAERITHPNGLEGPRDGMDYVPAPPASTIPSEPEARGKAGAGPVGEAVALQWRVRDRAPESEGNQGWSDWMFGRAPAHRKGQEVQERPLYAHPVEESGEVERLTRERDDMRDRAFAYARKKKDWAEDREAALVRAETAEAALAETRERLEKELNCLRDAIFTGLPTEELLRRESRLRTALSTQESSAALAGVGKDAGR